MSAGPLDIAAPAATPMNRKRPRRPLSSSVMIWIIAAVLFGLFSTIAPGFLTVFNLSSLLSEGVLVGFLAVGLTPVIISGNIDLWLDPYSGSPHASRSACKVTGSRWRSS
jgi:ABC-type xylose transport system permease subunit